MRGSFVEISVVHLQLALAVEDIRKEFSLVDYLFAVLVRPAHLSNALHLRINEVADVVSAVWPFELSVPLYLRID